MSDNTNLHRANKSKEDEFYTRLEDIENELRHYKKDFRDKVVFCNCDDPYESNFFKYFAMNFNSLGLKKLIATCYAASPVANTQLSLFDCLTVSDKDVRKSYKIEITEVLDYNNDGAVDLADVEYLLKNKKNTLTLLDGNGDFRSDECVELLKQADIVVTNPPFSLFREYMSLLIKYDKRFLIIGSKNAITYKEFFPLLKDDRVWIGYTNVKEFVQPDGSIKKFGNIGWFTNLDVASRHEKMILWKSYTPDEYPKYDNYDAVEVGKISDIPVDYDGVMGVPITFIDKFNPEQFEIIGLDRYTMPKECLVGGRAAVNGKPKYARILIKKK